MVHPRPSQRRRVRREPRQLQVHTTVRTELVELEKAYTLKLSLLIPTLVCRAAKLDRLLSGLAPQLTDDVELLQELDNGELPSGAKRNKLLARSQGEYVAFIDDDDTVDNSYVALLLEAIAKKPDVVTFNVLMFRNGKECRQRFGLYERDCAQGLDHSTMTANHLSAWRRSIATQVRFPDWLGYGDDQFWYKPLVAAGVARTEIHIDRELYFYHYSQVDTANQTQRRVHESRTWAGSGIDCFWYEGKIVVCRVPSGPRRRPRNSNEELLVYDNTGREFLVPRHKLRKITTCRLV